MVNGDKLLSFTEDVLDLSRLRKLEVEVEALKAASYAPLDSNGLIPLQYLTKSEGGSNLIFMGDRTLKSPQEYNVLDVIYNQNEIPKEPTGFNEPENVTVSYDSTERKITLSGTINAFWRGKLVTALVDGWVSDAHDATEGVWYLYYDGETELFTWSSTVWTYDKLQIALVAYRTGYKFGQRDCHGFMPWQTHLMLHDVIGCYKSSGGTLSNYTLASTTAAQRRPDIAETVIKDEDVTTTNAELLKASKYTNLYLSGSGLITMVTDQDDIVPLNGAIPYYNLLSGGTWSQEPMTNNKYSSVWLVAIAMTADTASQKYRYLWIQGQSEGSLESQQSLTPNSLNVGILSLLPFEYTFIQQVIIKYQGGDWTIEQVVTLYGNKSSQSSFISGGSLSVNTDGTTISGLGTPASPLAVIPGGVDHALLANLNSANYTHLTAANVTGLTGGGITSLHSHAVVASGYLVYRTSGDYIKIASVTFTTFGRCCFSIDFVGGVYDLSNACGKLYVSISSFPFGDPPFVSIRLENHSVNIRPDDITADTRPGNATVDIWLRIESSRVSRINYFTNVGQGDAYQIPPTFYDGGATVASLPVDGTLTQCISSDSIGSGQPTSTPILTSAWYRDTNTNEIYHWDGTAWYNIPRGQPVGTDGRDE